MKWYKAILQWFLKSLLFVGCAVIFVDGITYFADGSYLIIDDAIPIKGLFAACNIPLGLLLSAGLLFVISETEKEMETPGG